MTRPTPIPSTLLRLLSVALTLVALTLATGDATRVYGQFRRQGSAAEPEVIVDLASTRRVLRYCRRIVEKYDSDKNGYLARAEWAQMRGDPTTVDRDVDNRITVEELARHVADYSVGRRIRPKRRVIEGVDDIEPLLNPMTEAESPDLKNGETPTQGGGNGSVEGAARPSLPTRVISEKEAAREKRFAVRQSRLPGGLPPWFVQRDTNGDGQLTLAEFAPKASRSTLSQFGTLDANNDGLLTPREYLRSVAKPSKVDLP